MAFRITPSLGPDSEQTGPGYFDAGQPGISFQPGSRHTDSAGRERIWVQASGALTADTQVALDAATFAATAPGTSGWYTVAAVADGDWFHARLGAATAIE